MRPRRRSTMAIIVDGKSGLLEMIRSFPKLMMLFLLSLEFAPGTLASASDSMLDTEHIVYSRSWKGKETQFIIVRHLTGCDCNLMQIGCADLFADLL